MRPTFRTLAPLAVTLALALVVLAPVASADHAYTHRYVVFGRLVDATGLPIPDVRLQLSTTPDLRPEGSCSNQPGTGTDAFLATAHNLTTNAYGEFILCMHLHTLARESQAQIQLIAMGVNASAVIDVDPLTRAGFAVLQSEGNEGRALPTADHTVQGRAWRANHTPPTIDGIRVYGDTLRNVPVTITLPGLEPVNTTTNNYGDFAVRIPFEAAAPEGEALIVVDGTEFRAPVGSVVGVTYLKAAFPAIDPLPATPSAAPTAPATATPAPTTSALTTPAGAEATSSPTPTPTPAPTTTATPEQATPFPVMAALALAVVLALTRTRR